MYKPSKQTFIMEDIQEKYNHHMWILFYNIYNQVLCFRTSFRTSFRTFFRTKYIYFRTVAIHFRTFTIALQSQQKVPLLGINAIVSLLYNPTKITQANRHLTTTQSCLQYPNQELLLQYPMLETHGSWLVM